jgi:ankyrin repeat protein
MDPRWIDVGDHNGDTLLHAAAMALNNSSSDTNHQASSNCEVLEFLLSCEASPDIANHQGMTPSHIAKSVAALKVLAKYKAQLYCMDSRGRLPIWHACFDNRIECVRFLLTKTPRSYILWPDETEGDNCLHVAAKQGHSECIESVLSFFFDSSSTESEGASDNGPVGDDCLYSTNKRQYSIAHCASNSMVLRVLYEFGMNLFITDAKDHMPLFIMSFYNRLDCVVYLLDMATSSTSAMKNSSVSQKKSSYNIAHADRQGDTALHISCVAGHGGVAQILLLYLSNEAMKNTQGFRPSDLARKAGNVQLADCVEYYETVFRPTTAVGDSSVPPLLSKNELMQKIFHSVVTYGSRWTKCFDLQYDAMYYFDHVTNEAVWERPPGFDLPRHDDEDFDKALNLLRKFYKKHNPDKMVQINDILFLYRRRYTELFITLAQRYSLSDLSMFKGIYFHDGTVPQSSQGPFSPPPSTNQLGPKRQ